MDAEQPINSLSHKIRDCDMDNHFSKRTGLSCGGIPVLFVDNMSSFGSGEVLTVQGVGVSEK